MPLSGLRAADLGRIWPMGLGKPCRDEHADGIEAEVVRPEQHVVGRVGLAEGRAQLPLVGSQQLADPLAPVAAEHRLLDVVAIGDTERRAPLEQVSPHDRRWKTRRAQRSDGGLPALLEGAAGAFLEGASDLRELDPALEVWV